MTGSSKFKVESSKLGVLVVLALGLVAGPGAQPSSPPAFAEAAAGRQAFRPSSPQAPLGIGRAATPEEIGALDIDVMPDGRGLPPGRGSVAEGRTVYAAKCATCHGASGEGGSAERLVGRDAGANWDFATDARLVKTVGNYWPYATTLFDYTRRAMPFNQPGTLAADETYALVAFILALNKIVPDDAVLDQTTLAKVVMPARDRFVPDTRVRKKPGG
jgi:cytochrome c